LSENPADVLIDAINRWHDDPVGFKIEALGMNPAQWQRNMSKAVQDNLRVSVRAGRGPGKSAECATDVLWFLLTRTPALILVTGPKYEQVIDVIWAEVELWRQKLPAGLREAVIVQKDIIYIKDMERINRAIARTARNDNPDALRGYHSKNMLIICEESSGIPDKAFVIGEGSMSTPGARTVLVGNMSRTTGYFYDSHFTDDRWHRIHVNAEDVAEERPDIVSRDYIEHMRKKYGRDSDEYRIEVLGEPPLADHKAVIPRYLIMDAVYREVDKLPGYLPVWGLDVGRSRDRSALAKRQGNYLLEPIKWWRISDTMAMVDAVIDEYEQQEKVDKSMLPSEILVDVIGVGGPVVDALRRARLPVRGINVAEAHSSKDRYMRKRDELWFKAKDWFEARDCSIPNDKDLVGELASVECDLTTTGKWKVQSKADIVAMNRESPDLADSFILTFAGGYDRLFDAVNPDRYAKRRQRDMEGTGSWMSL
jgi:phage terminase large subunit